MGARAGVRRLIASLPGVTGASQHARREISGANRTARPAALASARTRAEEAHANRTVRRAHARTGGD